MEAGPSTKANRLRAYKACENCRLRKIKCSGETPCRSCTSSDIADKCFVRVKAKPNRAPAKILDLETNQANQSTSPTSETVQSHPQVSPSSLPPDDDRPIHRISPGLTPRFTFSYDSPGQGPEGSPSGLQASTPYSFPSAAYRAKRSPLLVLEDALAAWCAENDVSLRPLLFQDEMRIAPIEPPPLPSGQFLVEFEDDLMRSLVAAEDLDRLEVLDCPRLLNLYSRYRALPHTLTDDQTALVYASLCIARFTQLRGGVATGMKEPRTLAREDITYYRLSREALARWGRASITSMWAIFCLITYVQINGGAEEHREVLGLMAWQVQALGLHRRDTAQLYPAHELGAPLLLAYAYAETFRSIMTDFTPAIPIAELELGAQHELRGVNHGLSRAHSHAVNYLRDFANPDIDITTAGYLAVAEEAWSVDLDQLRAQSEVDFAKVRRGWAEMRIHWLRLLLHIPRMNLSPGRANQATIYATRSAINIINTHSEAALMGKLDPSWPQLKRIITCGQVLILCCARGEIQPMEGVDIFARLMVLLEAHLDFWPSVAQAIVGFKHAAAKLGIHIAHGGNLPLEGPNEVPLFPPLQMNNDDAAGWFLGLDLGTLAQDSSGNALW